MHHLLQHALRVYLRSVRPAFALDGHTYEYFWHEYNMTWRNERCVEVALAQHWLRDAAGKRVLEVGNVLSHYLLATHDIVDKYERAPGVWNEDVIDFAPDRRYDLIISISTLEHVGWDEAPRDAGKALAALHHLRNDCLAPAGRMLVTFPLGHHPELDGALAAGRLPFARTLILKREGRFMHWREATWPEVSSAAYGFPHPFANAIAVGTV